MWHDLQYASASLAFSIRRQGACQSVDFAANCCPDLPEGTARNGTIPLSREMMRLQLFAIQQAFLPFPFGCSKHLV